ncbi:hypothetical protein BJY00DRAFT_315302 [Aspergillus carlsbadensis]|nr:hypothetical protein BJY00DRAFT_315302 [Aspergillus carlsbadensis]
MFQPPVRRVLYCCPICDVPINRAGSLPGDLPHQPLEWHQKLYILRRENQDGPTTLSRVGYIDAFDGVNVPRDHAHSFEDANANIEVYSTSPGSWPRHFCLHALCWDILVQKTPGVEQALTVFTTFLFNMLHCAPTGEIQSGAVNWTAFSFGRPYLTEDPAPEGLGENLLAEPSQPQDVREILGLCGNVKADLKWPTDPPAGLATRSQINFYSMDKFNFDQEMGFARPANTDEHQDWAEAYLVLEHALRDGSTSMGLWNRRRIWRLSRAIPELFGQMADGLPLRGSSLGSPDVLFEVQPTTSNYPAGQKITAHSSTASDGRLVEGSRLLYERAVVLPLDEYAITEILICSASIYTYRFVTGLHFRLRHLATEAKKGISLGYVLATRNVVQVDPLNRVTGFELAVCARGIQAIKVLLKEQCVGTRPPWVGVHGHGEAPVAVGSVKFGHERRRVRLVACFDSLKMFGLGVFDASVPETEIRHVLKPQPVWTPSHPRETVVLLPQLRISPPRTFSPLLNMGFGGLYGERLVHLVKVVAHLSNDSSAAVGLSFYFNNQKAIQFGNRGRKRRFTLIDGPGGERISAIKFEQQGQSALSAQICTRIRAGRLFPKLSIPMLAGGRVPESNELKPALEQRITGFTAVLAANSHCFQSFSLQCEEIPWWPVDSQVNLKEIKQIYFSGGDPDGEEPQRAVPGLRFDYHEGSSSKIGECFPGGRSMDLSGGGRIVGITIWLSKITTISKRPFHFGWVARMVVESSLLRAVTHPEDSRINDDEHVILRFRENHLEELDLLVWKYNGNLDDIRVLSSPKALHTRISFWYSRQFSQGRRWNQRQTIWANPQRVLWTEPDEHDTLASVTAYHGRKHKHLVVGFRATYLSGVT